MGRHLDAFLSQLPRNELDNHRIAASLPSSSAPSSRSVSRASSAQSSPRKARKQIVARSNTPHTVASSPPHATAAEDKEAVFVPLLHVLPAERIHHAILRHNPHRRILSSASVITPAYSPVPSSAHIVSSSFNSLTDTADADSNAADKQVESVVASIVDSVVLHSISTNIDASVSDDTSDDEQQNIFYVPRPEINAVRTRSLRRRRATSDTLVRSAYEAVFDVDSDSESCDDDVSSSPTKNLFDPNHLSPTKTIDHALVQNAALPSLSFEASRVWIADTARRKEAYVILSKYPPHCSCYVSAKGRRHNSVKIGRQSWKKYYIEIRGSYLLFFNSNVSANDSDLLFHAWVGYVSLATSGAKIHHAYKKRKNVVFLHVSNKYEYYLQTKSRQESLQLVAYLNGHDTSGDDFKSSQKRITQRFVVEWGDESEAKQNSQSSAISHTQLKRQSSFSTFARKQSLRRRPVSLMFPIGMNENNFLADQEVDTIKKCLYKIERECIVFSADYFSKRAASFSIDTYRHYLNSNSSIIVPEHRDEALFAFCSIIIDTLSKASSALIPSTYHPILIETARSDPTEQQNIHALRIFFLSYEENSMSLLSELCLNLHRLAYRSEDVMDAVQTLCQIFVPVLFRPVLKRRRSSIFRRSSLTPSLESILSDSPDREMELRDVLTLFILYAPDIFEV